MNWIGIILTSALWFYVGWVIGHSKYQEKRQKKSINRCKEWVLVKERMPNVADWMRCESEFLVSTKNEVHYCLYDACTNKFVGDNVDGEIVAWMPLPEPYQEESI